MEYTKLAKEYELSLNNNVILTEGLPLVWSCSIVSPSFNNYALKLNLLNVDLSIEQRTALTTLSVFSRFEHETEYRPASTVSVNTLTYNDHYKDNIIDLYFKKGFLAFNKDQVRFKLIVTVHIPKISLPKPVDDVSSDFTAKNPLNDQILSVGVGCGRMEFHVNRAALSLVSPYFKNRFAGHKKNEKIILAEIDPKEFEVFLKLINPSNVTVNEDNASFLWKLADRFGIISVAKMCQGFLFNVEVKDTVDASPETPLNNKEPVKTSAQPYNSAAI